jgi:TP53 regulating kinase and related kinases
MRLMRKGAEACLYRHSYLGLEVVRKQRVPKPYRHPEMDREIRTERTILEGRLLSEAKRNGVPTPALYQIDTETATLVMEYLGGTTLRDSIASMSKSGISRAFEQFGEYVAQLHNSGIVHGDLTTSNVIVNGGDNLSIIDFGLGNFSTELEPRGVDLHLLLRTLESSHHTILAEGWESFQKGYRRKYKGKPDQVIEKVREIRRRGRYVEERRQK